MRRLAGAGGERGRVGHPSSVAYQLGHDDTCYVAMPLFHSNAQVLAAYPAMIAVSKPYDEKPASAGNEKS